MTEYIEREAAIAAIMSEPTDAHYPHWYADKIKKIQAANVATVRNGRWDDSGRYRFPGGSIAVRCSECGCALTASEYKLNNWNYCPVCGAKMDGDK